MEYYLTSSYKVVVSSVKKLRTLPFQSPKEELRSLYSLKLHICVLSVLGIIPFKRESIHSKIYAFIVLGTSVTATILTALIIFVVSPNGNVVLEKFIEVATILFLGIFFSSLIYSNRKTISSWRNLLRMLSIFDKSFPKKKPSSNEKILIILKLTMIPSLPLMYYVSYLIIWKLHTDLNSLSGYLFYITQGVGLVYEVQISAFLWEITSVLLSRYKHLEKHLKDLLVNRLPSQQMLHYAFEYNIVMIKYKYKILYIAVEEINAIFGWIILLLLIHVTTAFLMNFYDTIYTSGATYKFYIEGFSFGTFLAVSFFC